MNTRPCWAALLLRTCNLAAYISISGSGSPTVASIGVLRMKTTLLLSAVLTLTTIVVAQEIPTGTIVPLSLDTTLDSGHSKPGQKVIARVAQDVPLPNGAKLKTGTRVTGEVITATPANGSQPASITLSFHQINLPGHTIPVSTNLRAIASPLDVQSAQYQHAGLEKVSSTPWSQNTVQIGGDAVYREPGLVESRGERVGESVYAGSWGVLARVSSDPGSGCRGEVGGNDSPQALWVFSHDACGVFGLEAVIKDAGRTSPAGQFVLESTKRDLKLRSGTGLLLRVNGTQPASGGEAAK